MAVLIHTRDEYYSCETGYPFDDSSQIGNNSFNFERNNSPDFIHQFWRTVWRWIIHFREPMYNGASLQKKNRRRGVCGGRGRLCKGQSQTDNQFLALVWIRPITKIPASSFFNDSHGLYRTTVCRWLVRRASLFRAANAFRVTWSEQVRHRNALTEIAWDDAVQGLGMAMSTVASEKNREMLFIGNVFYKQWHLCVLFH